VLLSIVLPTAISLMAPSVAQGYYVQGFQTAALAVVFIMVSGAVIAAFHKTLYEPTKGAPPSLRRADAASASD